MSRVYNFSAGPSMLPLEVLERAQREMLDCNGSGQSVMEMSHRSSEYQAIIDEAEALFREVLSIPDNYKVMFLQGGASTQFAMVPLNLGNKTKTADYITTGQWAKKALAQAKAYVTANEIASSADATFNYIPKVDKSMLTPNADYLHITYNNTIYGTHYNNMPDFGDATVVADMSSSILSEPVDINIRTYLCGSAEEYGPRGRYGCYRARGFDWQRDGHYSDNAQIRHSFRKRFDV